MLSSNQENNFSVIECAGFKVFVENDSAKAIVEDVLNQADARKWYSNLSRDVILAAQVNPGKVNIFALNVPNVEIDARSIIYYHQNVPYEIKLSTIDVQDFKGDFMHEISHATLDLANTSINNLNLGPQALEFKRRLQIAMTADLDHQKSQSLKYVPIQKKVFRTIFGEHLANYLIGERVAEHICFTLQAVVLYGEKAVQSVTPHTVSVLKEYVEWELANVKQTALSHQKNIFPIKQIENKPNFSAVKNPLGKGVIYPDEIIDGEKISLVVISNGLIKLLILMVVKFHHPNQVCLIQKSCLVYLNSDFLH